MSKLTARGYKVNFNKNVCVILDKTGTKEIAIGDQVGNLYRLRKLQSVNLIRDNTCVHYWHKVLGHRDIEVVKDLQRNGLVQSIEIDKCGDNCTDNKCTICLEGKLTRNKFPKESKSKSNAVLDLVHTDICGPMQTVSPSGKRYILTFIDDISRYTVIFLLENKSAVLSKFKEYVELGKTKFGKKVKCIRSDRGGEYLSNDFKKYLAKEGITNQCTAPYTPQQNGVAERKNRTLIEMARCMLLDSQCEKKFWGEAVNMANYVQNRIPTRGINKTPFEIWNGVKPNIGYFRMFGAKCYVHIPCQKRKKLDSTGIAGILMGYDSSSKAYRVYIPSTDKLVISRDVQFVNKNNKWSNNCVNEIYENTQILNKESDHSSVIDSKDSDDLFIDDGGQIIIPEVSYKRSERKNRGIPPKRLIEEINLAIDSEPQTYNQAVSGNDRENWILAMEEEMKSLHENGTWELTDLPENKKPIGCKWVYKIKTNENGVVTRYKARLVA